MPLHVRLARPVSDLARSTRQYTEGLGLVVLAQFEDHEGFDGVMLGQPGAGHHLEFTHARRHPVAPAPTPEDLLVFYVPDEAEFAQRCARLLDAGFAPVASFNPYWDERGRSFQDADGYRVVLQHADWE